MDDSVSQPLSLPVVPNGIEDFSPVQCESNGDQWVIQYPPIRQTSNPPQRIIGPPSKWSGPPPSEGSQILIQDIPKHLLEDDLVDVFNMGGTLGIYNIRLVMSRSGHLSEGYCFVQYFNQEQANAALSYLDEYCIQPCHPLRVSKSELFTKVFVTEIPNRISPHELTERLDHGLEGVMDILTFSDPNKRNSNDGFCIVSFKTKQLAAVAIEKLQSENTIFNHPVKADFERVENEPELRVMLTVKRLFVSGLTKDVSQTDVYKRFQKFGKVNHVFRDKHYAFVHFVERQNALEAMAQLNGQKIKSATMKVELAKPINHKKVVLTHDKSQ